MTETQGEIIITLESEERHYSYDQLGLTFEQPLHKVERLVLGIERQSLLPRLLF